MLSERLGGGALNHQIFSRPFVLFFPTLQNFSDSVDRKKKKVPPLPPPVIHCRIPHIPSQRRRTSGAWAFDEVAGGPACISPPPGVGRLPPLWRLREGQASAERRCSDALPCSSFGGCRTSGCRLHPVGGILSRLSHFTESRKLSVFCKLYDLKFHL